MTRKTVFASIGVLLVLLTGCGGEDASAPPPISPAPTPTPIPTQTVISPDITYGSGAVVGGAIALQLDIYRPELACPTPRPTVVFVHGGGFVGGSRKGGNVEAIAQELTRRGINLISISCRLEGDNPVIGAEFADFERDFQALGTTGTPAQITAFTAAVEDAVRALRWAASNAATYCIDPNRFGVWGSSAGAFTVMHIAYSLDEYAIVSPPVLVAVDYWGGIFRPADLEAGEAPLFVLHGTADTTVPYARAVEITDRARTAGVPFTLYTITGGEHGFGPSGFFELLVDNQSIAANTATFVDAHLRPGGQPVYEQRDIPR